MKRKSPIRHRVKRHTREGKNVSSFNRGHGKNTIKQFTVKRKIEENSQKKIKSKFQTRIAYHITTKETAEKIKKEGFKPNGDWWGYGTWFSKKPLIGYMPGTDVIFKVQISGRMVDVDANQHIKEFTGDFYDDGARHKFLDRNGIDVVLGDDTHWFAREGTKIKILQVKKVPKKGVN